MHQPGDAMNDRERDTIRKRLLDERRTRMETLAALDQRYRERLELGDDELSNYPLHLADEGTDTMEQEKEFLLASQDGRELMDIDAALRKLLHDPDELGACEECGQAIGLDRLEMIPWALLCIDCQTAAEGDGAGGPGV
jgi:DnaK suppressor protein